MANHSSAKYLRYPQNTHEPVSNSMVYVCTNNLPRKDTNFLGRSVNICVRRCGGGYGAKLGRSAITAEVCALAAQKLNKPVRMVMQLELNMQCIGKRYPMYAKYEVRVVLHRFRTILSFL